jgi:hypothetical protein
MTLSNSSVSGVPHTWQVASFSCGLDTGAGGGIGDGGGPDGGPEDGGCIGGGSGALGSLAIPGIPPPG